MRVLLVIDGMSPRFGGPPRVVLGSAIALVKAGHDVTVLSGLLTDDRDAVNEFVRRGRDCGVKFAFVEPLRAIDVWRHPRNDILRKCIGAADVVHCHGIWSPLFLVVADLAYRSSKPYLVSVHGLLSPWAVRKSRLKKWIARKFFGVTPYLERASAVIFGTRGEHISSADFGANFNAVYIPNGTSNQVSIGPPSEIQRASLLKIAPAIADWKKLILFYSRIHPKKGLDMLITAFETIAQDFPGTGLLIAGLPEDIEYQRLIERKIAESDYTDRIVITTELTGDRGQFLYSLADVFALPSYDEGFSMSLLEAVASGCPSLSTHLCHCPEIEENGAGVVVDPTPDAIASGLSKLLSQTPEAAAKTRSNALSLFQSRFTWSKVAGELVSQYEKAFTS